MNIPTYRTWVAAEIVTALEMNSNIRDGGNFALGKPYCSVYNNAGVSCTTNIYTLVPFDTEVEDNDSMHSTGTNPSRMIFQTPGVFDIDAATDWPSSATGNRQLQIRLNSAGSASGGTFLAQRDATPNASGGTSVYPTLGMKYRAVNIGDYLEMFIKQVTGGTVTSPGGPNALFLSVMYEIV